MIPVDEILEALDLSRAQPGSGFLEAIFVRFNDRVPFENASKIVRDAEVAEEPAKAAHARRVLGRSSRARHRRNLFRARRGVRRASDGARFQDAARLGQVRNPERPRGPLRRDSEGGDDRRRRVSAARAPSRSARARRVGARRSSDRGGRARRLPSHLRRRRARRPADDRHRHGDRLARGLSRAVASDFPKGRAVSAGSQPAARSRPACALLRARRSPRRRPALAPPRSAARAAPVGAVRPLRRGGGAARPSACDRGRSGAGVSGSGSHVVSRHERLDGRRLRRDRVAGRLPAAPPGSRRRRRSHPDVLGIPADVDAGVRRGLRKRASRRRCPSIPSRAVSR